MTTTTYKSTPSEKIDLSTVMPDMLMVLNPKEKEVITRRFNLSNKGKETLESIGQSFSVTRERIRQIEEIGLLKLKRTVKSTQIAEVIEVAREVLAKHGGILEEQILVSEILNAATTGREVDGHMIKLGLAIDEEMESLFVRNKIKKCWHLSSISPLTVKEALTIIHSSLKKNKDVMTESDLLTISKKELSKKHLNLPSTFIRSCFDIDERFKQTEDGYGLMSWRHVNPHSLRDKAYIVMKKHGKPVHFMELANMVTNAGFDNKVVRIPAIHNEVIRSPHFVLIGRGLYALAEWGYQPGMVAEVILQILKKSKKSMSKKQLLEEVLKVRNVKEGTINLNIQNLIKSKRILRTRKGVYTFNKAGKPLVTTGRRGGHK